MALLFWAGLAVFADWAFGATPLLNKLVAGIGGRSPNFGNSKLKSLLVPAELGLA